jgi:hypothetical protein
MNNFRTIDRQTRFLLPPTMTDTAKERERGAELSLPGYTSRIFPERFGEIFASRKHFTSFFSRIAMLAPLAALISSPSADAIWPAQSLAC